MVILLEMPTAISKITSYVTGKLVLPNIGEYDGDYKDEKTLHGKGIFDFCSEQKRKTNPSYRNRSIEIQKWKHL